MLLHPKWRRIATGVNSVVASGQLVAIDQGSERSGKLILLDELHDTRQVLTPPDCPLRDVNQTLPIMAAPWLMVSCGPPEALDYRLYNIIHKHWSSFAISPQCQLPDESPCFVEGIGRYWVKIGNHGPMEYSPTEYYLQSIQSGDFISDPASPGGRVSDDLNAASGSSPLCAPLRYPTSAHRESELGSIHFYGSFAVTFSFDPRSKRSWLASGCHLRRCHSRLNLVLSRTINPNPQSVWEPHPVSASSRAVIIGAQTQCCTTPSVSGWLLPSLRPATIYLPSHTRTAPVAVSDRTIYVNSGGQVWAGKLPPPARRPR